MLLLATLIAIASTQPQLVPACAAMPGPVTEGEMHEPIKLAQVTIEQRIIIRVPVDAPRPGKARPPRAGEYLRPGDEHRRGDHYRSHGFGGWAEEKGPRCISARLLDRAIVLPRGGVDVLMRDRSRLRLRLSRDCMPADFYAGFYIQPAPDGSLCAGRDSLLARSGMSCEIRAFRRLVPAEPDFDDHPPRKSRFP